MGFSRQEYWSELPFPSPGGSSWPRDWTRVSCTGRRILYHWATREAQLPYNTMEKLECQLGAAEPGCGYNELSGILRVYPVPCLGKDCAGAGRRPPEGTAHVWELASRGRPATSPPYWSFRNFPLLCPWSPFWVERCLPKRVKVPSPASVTVSRFANRVIADQLVKLRWGRIEVGLARNPIWLMSW